MARSAACEKLRRRLIDFALTLPEAWEDHPWDEVVAKVGKKVFVFFGSDPNVKCFNMTVKLPDSGPDVLNEPFAEPSGYGLGRSGWVTFSFESTRQAPADFLEDLIVESYCAIAPKKLAERADEQRSAAVDGP